MSRPATELAHLFRALDALERRERWVAGRDRPTVHSAAAGIDAIDELRIRALPVVLNAEQVGVVVCADRESAGYRAW
jgi:hypothetical protein